GRHNRHNRWIELDRVGGRGEAHDGRRHGKREIRQRMLCGHWLLPVSTLYLPAACFTPRLVLGSQSSSSASLSKVGSDARARCDEFESPLAPFVPAEAGTQSLAAFLGPGFPLSRE